jgi:hypothetical protein
LLAQYFDNACARIRLPRQCDRIFHIEAHTIYVQCCCLSGLGVRRPNSPTFRSS